ncbi:hypothetical protein [Marinicellulosiphila megalodicopiae]|uniref:hypothetical protein n=1 Tax=Marinicellulosiphila megalodicopiae TaxID=2724896 RepID=UPI003BB01A0E
MEAFVAVVNSHNELENIADRQYTFTQLFDCEQSPLLVFGENLETGIVFTEKSDDSQNEQLIANALSNIANIDISECQQPNDHSNILLFIHEYAIEKLTDPTFLDSLFTRLNSQQILVGVPNKGYLAVGGLDDLNDLCSMTTKAYQNVETPICADVFKLTQGQTTVERIGTDTLNAFYQTLEDLGMPNEFLHGEDRNINEVIHADIYQDNYDDLLKLCQNLIHNRLDEIFTHEIKSSNLILDFSTENSKQLITTLAKDCKQYFDYHHFIRDKFRYTLTSISIQFKFGNSALNFELGYSDFAEFNETDCSIVINNLQDCTFEAFKKIVNISDMYIHQNQQKLSQPDFPEDYFELGLSNQSFRMIEALFEHNRLTLNIKQLSAPTDYKWILAMCARVIDQLQLTIDVYADTHLDGNIIKSQFKVSNELLTYCSSNWIKQRCKDQLQHFTKHQLANPLTLSLIPASHPELLYCVSHLSINALLQNKKTFSENFWKHFLIFNYPENYNYQHAQVETLNISQEQCINIIKYRAESGLIVNSNQNVLFVLTDQESFKIVTRFELEKKLLSEVKLLADNYSAYPALTHSQFKLFYQTLTPLTDDVVEASAASIKQTEIDTALTNGMFAVFLLISQADGQIDQKEIDCLGKVLKDAATQKAPDSLWSKCCTLAVDRLATIWQLISDEQTSTDIILKTIFALNQLEDTQSKEFKFKLLDLGYNIAQNKLGKFLDSENEIGESEQLALDAVSHLLGIEAEQLEAAT